MTPSRLRRTHGFTLVEAIVVIAIAGLVAGMVALFMRTPIDSYLDAERRAGLTNAADTATRRIARELRLALPNSVRTAADATGQCIEFMPTRIGLRYRAEVDSSGAGNVLDFTSVDDSFDMFWPNSELPAEQRIAAQDVVVVYNDGSTDGDAYLGNNAIRVASVSEPGSTAVTSRISFVDTGTGSPYQRKRLPSASPGSRFQIVPGNANVVAYRCNAGVLTRHTRTLAAAWPRPASCAAMVAGATSATLASGLSTCSLVYDPPGASTGLARNGIVSMTLGISDGVSGETLTLYHQVEVDNQP